MTANDNPPDARIARWTPEGTAGEWIARITSDLETAAHPESTPTGPSARWAEISREALTAGFLSQLRPGHPPVGYDEDEDEPGGDAMRRAREDSQGWLMNLGEHERPVW